MTMPRNTSTKPASAADAPRMAMTTSLASITAAKNKERPGCPGLSVRAPRPSTPCVARSASGSDGAEAGESVEVAHQRVAAGRATALHGLGRRIRGTHEPRQEHLVLRVVVPVRAVGSVRVGSLKVRVAAHGEADADHRVAGLHDTRAAVLRCGRCDPGLDPVVVERVVRPLRELVAQGLAVLHGPGGAAVGAGGDAGSQ